MQGNAKGNANGSGNIQGNAQGNAGLRLQGNVDSNVNARLNGNAGLNLSLHLGFRRSNGKHSRQPIFVPMDETSDRENLRSFGNRKRYVIFCIRN